MTDGAVAWQGDFRCVPRFTLRKFTDQINSAGRNILHRDQLVRPSPNKKVFNAGDMQINMTVYDRTKRMSQNYIIVLGVTKRVS